MKTILITLPEFFECEASLVNEMFCAGLEILHLRKPSATLSEMETFILSIDKCFYNKIVIHSHFLLIDKYKLKGAHLSNNRPLDVPHTGFQLSFSCHTFSEVEREKNRCAYVFLSPIFDSISKQGYESAFTSEQLAEARAKAIIDHQVVALGGITPDNYNKVKEMGFGGVAILGDVWQDTRPTERLIEYLKLSQNLR